MRNEFENFITTNTNFDAEILKVIRFFKLLITIRNVNDFSKNFEAIKRFDNTVNPNAGNNIASLKKNLDRKKKGIYKTVDDSDAYNVGFKDHLQKTLAFIILNDKKKKCAII